MKILNRYYSKKCRITWIINKNKKKLKSLNERRSSSSYNISSKKINNKNNEEEIEIELEMKIDKIKIDNFLIGYYFYFNRIKKKKKTEKNKVRFIIQENEYNMKVYIKFPELNQENSYNISENKFNQTQILSGPIIFHAEKTNNKKRRKSYYENNDEKDYIIGPDYICKSQNNFLFDLNSLSYINSTSRNNLKKLKENLKRDVLRKIKINQFQYNSLKNRKKIFSLSQIKKYGTTVIQEVSSSSFSNSDSYTNSSSSYTSENSEESDSSYILKKKKSIPKNDFKLGYLRRSSKTVVTEIRKNDAEIKEKFNVSKNDYLSIINKNNEIKELNQLNNEIEYINNFYNVNLTMKNIHFLIFDFYKEIFKEKKDFKKISTVEEILNKIKAGNLNCFGDRDEKYPIILFENKNFVKNDEEAKISEKKHVEEVNTKIKNEEKILEKKIKYSINNEKDEIPIQRLKIFSIIFLIILMVSLTIFYTYFINNHSNINKILKLIKNSIKLKYCNRISAFFVGESILLNFNAK